MSWSKFVMAMTFYITVVMTSVRQLFSVGGSVAEESGTAVVSGLEDLALFALPESATSLALFR